jgi:DNA-binding transcriptional LysR family regulator
MAAVGFQALMNIDIEGLRAFIAVAEAGSFHLAADGLFISHSALSRRISRLEGYLGVRLLDRTTRRVELTTVGRNFLPQARGLMEDLETSFSHLRKIAKHGAGEIVLASIPSAGVGILPWVVETYSRNYPQNRIRILDMGARDVFKAVLAGEAELGLTLSDISDKRTEKEALLHDYFYLACRRDHPLAAYECVTWAQLQHQRVIAPGLVEGNRPLLDVGVPGKVLRENWYYEVQRFSTGMALAARGVGVAVVPGVALASHEHPELVFKRLVQPDIGRGIVVLRRRGATLSPAASEFLTMLREYGANYTARNGPNPDPGS